MRMSKEDILSKNTEIKNSAEKVLEANEKFSQGFSLK